MPISVTTSLNQARLNMITQQLRTNGVLDAQILTAIEQVPREIFVSEIYRQVAYADMNLPLAHQQVMLTPTEEARLLQALSIKPDDNLLEIGTGSGYMTALFAQFAKSVTSVDIFEDFSAQAQIKLAQLSLNNIFLQTGDAACGWGQPNTYDVIAITGSLPFLPNAFRQSLRNGGRLAAIVDTAPNMHAVVIKRIDEQNWMKQKLFETVVPPLINAEQLPAFSF